MSSVLTSSLVIPLQPDKHKHSVLQGDWKPKQIDNPNYKGAWEHPEIDNPEYSADSNIYKFDNIGVLGLDLWQVRGKDFIVEYYSYCCSDTWV